MKKKIPEYLLLPFSGVYGTAVYLRNKLFDWNVLLAKEFKIPVISVGNLRAGGTGKTPHVEYLVRLLKDNYRVAVLSRGYKRNTKGFLLAEYNSAPDLIGDESCQIKRKFPDISVAVDEKRVRGIEKLLEMNPSPEIILLDDAFQHRYVKPGLSILLDDYYNPASKDFLLPFGRLREPVSAKSRADILLITKSPSSLSSNEIRIRKKELKLKDYQQLYYSSLTAGDLQAVFSSQGKKQKKISGILLVSGIANPSGIRALISDFNPNIRELVFPDHYSYAERDTGTILTAFSEMKDENNIIITTEKDAVKLREFEDLLVPVKDKMYYLPVSVEILNNEAEKFNTQIFEYVKSNK